MSQFTPAQQQAIAARGNVLVVAGAGTGKTRTLIERCLRLLREGASLEQMLIVTFTNAAAAEMRARLRKALEAEAAASVTGPTEHFAEQIALLDTAQISTLHSFCLSLLREHFHALAIDPQVVVLDERQTRPLARECLTEVLAAHYAGRHPHSVAIQQLIRRGGRGSDDNLRKLVWKLHCHAQSLPDPDAWFTAMLADSQNAEPLRWHEWLLTACRDWRANWRPLLEDTPVAPAFVLSRAALQGEDDDLPGLATVLRAVTEADLDWPRGTKKFRDDFKKFFDDAAFLLALTGADGSAAALAEDWDWSRHEMAALLELTRQFAARFTEAKRQLGGVDFADVEQLSLRLLNDEHSGAARRCRERFAHVFVDEYQDINAAQDAILHAVSRTGAEANRFLVGDIKQSIYRFRLANPRIFAGYAQAWRESSNVIALSDNFRSHEAVLNFVNALFRPLMRASVGGVTYDAEAELRFGNPSDRTPLAVVSGAAPRVELHVLTSDEAADSTESDDAQGDAEELLAIEREARFVATRLRDLRDGGHAVWDEAAHAFRPVEWRDMVVLMRSPGSRGEAFAKEFHRAGVPLHAERGGFYESLEVTDLLNLLRLLDNPLQDLPLLAVLRSPLVGMSLEELVAIRGADERGLFWDALTKFRAAGEPRHEVQSLAAPAAQAALPPHPGPLPPGEGGGTNALRPQNPVGSESATDPLAPLSEAASCALTLPTILPLPAGEGRGEGEASELSSANVSPGGLRQTAFPKAGEFLTRFAEWRQLIRLGSLTQCLERVLTETHYEALLLAEPRGAERVANVRRLLDLARQFDPLQRQGLHRFLRFIEAQEEAALDHDPAPLPTEDAVRLMSIHQSKGLEFPVVVLAGLGVRFNLRDLSGDILLDAEMGLCPMVSPPQSQRRFPSLPHWLAKQRGQRELLGEELRLLYVALTRARDTLLLCGTDAGKDVTEKWRGPAAAINDLALLKARRPLDWLRLWLPTVTSEADWRGDAAGRSGLVSWNFYAADEVAFANASAPAPLTPALSPGGGEGGEAVVDSQAPGEQHEAELVAALRARLSQSYQHTAATHEPAKTSVSVLRRRAEAEDAEATQLFPPRELPRARQRRTGQLTATQIGVAHHTFLQCVELSATGTLAELMAEAERLQTRGLLSDREAEALSLDDLLRFWDSEVGQLVRRHARETQREVPFTARFTNRELRELLLPGQPVRAADAEDFVIVQGVVDLAVFRPEEIWLLDYKTDHFDIAGLPEKVREHGPQLRLYAHALERIYQKPVTRRWLHLLALGRTEEL